MKLYALKIERALFGALLKLSWAAVKVATKTDEIVCDRLFAIHDDIRAEEYERTESMKW